MMQSALQDPANAQSMSERRRDFCRIVATKRVLCLQLETTRPEFGALLHEGPTGADESRV